MIELIFSVTISIIKSQLFVAALYIGSFVIEKSTSLKLLVHHFNWKKSTLNAKKSLNGASVEYVVICTGVFIYDLYNKHIDLQSIDIFGIGTTAFTNGGVVFLLWFYTMRWLVTGFRWFYDKYQGVDPNKSDDDLT